MLLDRSLEELPLFRLSDTADDAAISYTTDDGGRWRVLASPGDRLARNVRPGRLRRADAALSARPASRRTARCRSRCTRSCARWAGRWTDARTSSSAARSLGSSARCCSRSAAISTRPSRSLADVRFTLLSSVMIERRRSIGARSARAVSRHGRRRARRGARRASRRSSDRTSRARHVVPLNLARYLALPSPVARRLYRLIEVARAGGVARRGVSRSTGCASSCRSRSDIRRTCNGFCNRRTTCSRTPE